MNRRPRKQNNENSLGCVDNGMERIAGNDNRSEEITALEHQELAQLPWRKERAIGFLPHQKFLQ